MPKLQLRYTKSAWSLDRVTNFTRIWVPRMFPLGNHQSYWVASVATDGVVSVRDSILQLAIGQVVNGELVSLEDFFLNWFIEPDVDQSVFGPKLQKLMSTYKDCQVTEQKLLSGAEPKAALDWAMRTLKLIHGRGEVLLLHTGYGFDMDFLQAHFANWLGEDYTFPPELVYATGAVEAASQLDDPNWDVYPDDQHMTEWASRILRGGRKGVKWSMAGYCSDAYSLPEIWPPAAPVSPLWGDARATAAGVHYLFELQKIAAGIGVTDGEAKLNPAP